jgi:hypothetical protein
MPKINQEVTAIGDSEGYCGSVLERTATGTFRRAKHCGVKSPSGARMTKYRDSTVMIAMLIASGVTTSGGALPASHLKSLRPATQNYV